MKRFLKSVEAAILTKTLVSNKQSFTVLCKKDIPKFFLSKATAVESNFIIEIVHLQQFEKRTMKQTLIKHRFSQ